MSPTLFTFKVREAKLLTVGIEKDVMCPRWTCWPPIEPDETRCPPPAESILNWKLGRGAIDRSLERVGRLIEMLEGRALIVLSVDPEDLQTVNDGILGMGGVRVEGAPGESA